MRRFALMITALSPLKLPPDFLPRLVHAAELAQRLGEVVPREAFLRRIAAFDILVRGLPVEGDCFFGAVEDLAIQVPQLP